jgi:hypothetical protein
MKILSFNLKRCWLWVALAAFATFATRSEAQPYSIDWHKVAGGGGASSNGQFSVVGTVGQADASGPLSGGNFSLTGGFWALYALQTPGAPLLRIFLTSTNTAVVGWPFPSTGFHLQVNTNLATTNWNAVATPVIVVGTENEVIVSPPTGNRFYRLQNP